MSKETQFAVCRKGFLKAKTLKILNPTYPTLEGARDRRKAEDPAGTTTSIYKLVWGERPELIDPMNPAQ